jgi:rod shape-determining protein MreD
MNRFLRTTLLLATMALAGNVLLAPIIAFGPIAPDFGLIALAILALGEGAFAGTVGGFVLGLVADTAIPNLLGLNALCKSLAGYLVGRARSRLVVGLPLVEASVVTLMALGHDLLYLVGQSLLSQGPFFRPLFTEVVPSALYTGLLSLPMIRLADILHLLRREE